MSRKRKEPDFTEEQFENSLRAIRDIGFGAVNMFAYSPRPMTAAAKMPGQVPEEVKQARLAELITTNRGIIALAKEAAKA